MLNIYKVKGKRFQLKQETFGGKRASLKRWRFFLRLDNLNMTYNFRLRLQSHKFGTAPLNCALVQYTIPYIPSACLQLF